MLIEIIIQKINAINKFFFVIKTIFKFTIDSKGPVYALYMVMICLIRV